MKATIRYTPTDGFRIGEDAVVRVSEITHCLPVPGRHYALIYLTTGNALKSATPIEELERRIEAAEAEP